MKKKKTLLERINKYRITNPKSRVDFDYKKALGEARFNEIKALAEKQQLKTPVRTYV